MKSKIFIIFLIVTTSVVNISATTYSFNTNPSVVFIPPTPAPAHEKHYYHAVAPVKAYPVKYQTIIPAHKTVYTAPTYSVPTYSPEAKSHSTQYHSQDYLGQYAYGYSTSNGIEKNEARSADGTVVGGYSYVSPEGQLVVIKYTAGENGFQATGNVIPQQVEPTPEVIEATQSHMLAKAQAAAEADAGEVTDDSYVSAVPAATSYKYLPYVYSYPAGYTGYTVYNTHPHAYETYAKNYDMNMDKSMFNYKFSY